MNDEWMHRKVELMNALLNEIRDYKARTPSARCGYLVCYGGILNAYREGDLGFDEAVKELEKAGSSSSEALKSCRHSLAHALKAIDETIA